MIHNQNPLNPTQGVVDYLLMDCNSIVYDSVQLLKDRNELITDETVIEQVIFRIWEYIQKVTPKLVCYIAFDGVAPLSKMEQQKSRRYKTAATALATSATTTTWNTTCITPGTPFMAKLSKSIQLAFAFKEREMGVEKIIISTSDEIGEGEHKLFQWLRHNQSDQSVFVYGMDADLIMLSLLHLPENGNIWVFRETPKKEEKDQEDKSGETIYIDIQQLGAAIRCEMNLQSPVTASSDFIVSVSSATPPLLQTSVAAIREYIFLCFFLGNDFLPHFPSTCIRTGGIPKLIETYKSVGLGSLNRLLIHPQTGQIQWSEVRRFIDACARYEHAWLLQEYEVRNKMQRNLVIDPTKPNDILDNAPILLRGLEMYIQPQKIGWQQRYYLGLFGQEGNNIGGDKVRPICENYLEGLQWVYSYYTNGCVDWRWKFNYNYPPLWTDLAKYWAIPQQMVATKPFTPQEQLQYIMPPADKVIHLEYNFAFCRYLWESSVKY